MMHLWMAGLLRLLPAIHASPQTKFMCVKFSKMVVVADMVALVGNARALSIEDLADGVLMTGIAILAVVKPF